MRGAHVRAVRAHVDARRAGVDPLARRERDVRRVDAQPVGARLQHDAARQRERGLRRAGAREHGEHIGARRVRRVVIVGQRAGGRARPDQHAVADVGREQAAVGASRAAGVIVEQQPVADAAGHARRAQRRAGFVRAAGVDGRQRRGRAKGAEEEGGGVIEVREP